MQYKISKEKLKAFLEATEEIDIPLISTITDDKEEILYVQSPKTKFTKKIKYSPIVIDKNKNNIEVDKQRVLKLLGLLDYWTSI